MSDVSEAPSVPRERGDQAQERGDQAQERGDEAEARSDRATDEQRLDTSQQRKRESMDAAMRGIGRLHRRLHRVPLLGEPIARLFSRCMAVFPFLGPMRRTRRIEETLELMRQSGEEMGFPFEFSEPEGDHFVLELPRCPYGFEDAADQRPCDTAMEMDRFMLRLCGAELTIEDTIPKGAHKCRMVVRQR